MMNDYLLNQSSSGMVNSDNSFPMMMNTGIESNMGQPQRETINHQNGTFSSTSNANIMTPSFSMGSGVSYPMGLMSNLFHPTRFTEHFSFTHYPSPNIPLNYFNIETSIVDNNNIFGNVNVLNADATKQTKIIIMPTVIFEKFIKPILDHIRQELYTQVPSDHQSSSSCTTIENNSSPSAPCTNFDTSSPNDHSCDSQKKENIDEMHEGDDDDEDADEISFDDFSKQSSNNYKKANNMKGIKKKRKYIKSGLYRKDRNGNFLFSSSDRSRLVTLITTPGVNSAPTNQDTSTPGNVDLIHDSNYTETSNNMIFDESYFVSELTPSISLEERQCFELYCKEIVPLHKDAAINLDLLKEQWKVLPQEERDRYKRSMVMGTIETSPEPQPNSENNHEDISDFGKEKGTRVKRPLNAYNIFCKLHFPEFQQQYPDLTINQISKLIGEKWKSLSNQEKQPYIEKSKSSQPVVKKPLNSYNLYCKQNFEIFKKKYPDLSIHLLSRKVAAAWKSLTESEKRTYYEDAMKQRQDNPVQLPNKK